MELERPVDFTQAFCDTIVDALRGCYRWVGRRYRPAMAHGKAVDVYYTFNVRLTLPQ